MILFTNNPHGGALRKDLTEKQHKACSGEMQLVDGGKTVCHGKIATQINPFIASCIFKVSQPEPILFIEQI